MKYDLRLALAPVLCVALGACHIPGMGGGAKPTGQVVATVNGKEVTLLELRQELSGVTFSNPESRKAGEQAALQQILSRRILSAAAHDQGIDKTPEFAVEKQRTIDNLMASALQQKLMHEVPDPTRDEAVRFVSDHPGMFEDRKVFVVDQLRVGRPPKPLDPKELEPLKTLDQVQDFLKSKSIPFEHTLQTVDSLGANPQAIDAVMKLPAGEVFIMPANGGFTANVIQQTKPYPFTGDPAVSYALQAIKSQRVREAVTKELSAIVTRGAKSVQFNDAYKPAKAPGAAGAKPAASGAPAAPAAK